MTDFLVKCFEKDHDKTEDPQVRTRYGILASIVGICCNLLLFASKLFIGVLVNSVSVMADAFNNLSDAASSIIGFIGVRMAGKPADSDHPFGHGRIEYISAFIVAFLVIQVGFSLFKTSLGKVLHPEEVYFKWISVLILLISVGVKFWLSLFNRKLGSRINSKVMEATAADAMGDVMTTSAAILSLLALKYLNWNIDGIVGLAVSVAVMYGGLNIAKDTLAPLIGEAIEPEVYEEISNFVEGYEGILGTHDLIVHNYGPSHSMASIHAEVPSNYDPEYSHEIIDRIEREAMEQLGISLTIHMDPVETRNEEVLQAKHETEKAVEALDPRCSIHDFRMVNGEKQINLIFDFVIPREYSEEKGNELTLTLMDRLQHHNPKYQCVITLDRSYVEEQR